MKLSAMLSSAFLAFTCCHVHAAIVPVRGAILSRPYKKVYQRVDIEDGLIKRAVPPLIESKPPSKGPVKEMMSKAKDFAGTRKGALIIGATAAKLAFSGGFLYYMQQNQHNRGRSSASLAPTSDTANQQISLIKSDGGALNFSSTYASSNAIRPVNPAPPTVTDTASPSST